jgi:uncharacterized protein
MLLWCLILAVSFAAFGLSTISGGGAGLVLMPFLGLAVPIPQVPASLSIGTAASSLARIAAFRHAVRWDVVRHVAPAALPFTALGAWGLSRMNPAYLDLLLGLFLLGNLPLLFRRRPVPTPRHPMHPMHPALLCSIGATAGFLSGFTGAAGLIFNGFYDRLGLRKEEIIATRAANEIMLHLLKLGLYAAFGLLSARGIAAGAAVAMAAILSAWLMRYVLPYVQDHLFRHIGHAATVAAGVAMLTLAGGQIQHQDQLGVQFRRDPSQIAASLSWRRHIFSIEWESHDASPDELELSHRIRTTARGQDMIAS